MMSELGATQWMWVLLLLVFVFVVKLRAAGKTRGASYPLRASPPRPVDLAAIPGVDLDLYRSRSARLQELGFRHLLDYELPHLEVPSLRTVFTSFVSADRTIVATHSQKFSNQFAIESLSFTTWLPRGHRLITTNSPFIAPRLDRRMRHVYLPPSADAATLLRRHQKAARRNAGDPVLIGCADDLCQALVEAWTSEIRHLVERGLCQVQGQRVRATPAMASAIFWDQLYPFPPGSGPVQYFVGVLAPAALALGMLGLAAAGSPLRPVIPWMAGMLIGGAAGATFWNRGLFWALAGSLFVSYGATRDLAVTGAVVLAAVVGAQVGFAWNAGRAKARGRRAIASR